MVSLSVASGRKSGGWGLVAVERVRSPTWQRRQRNPRSFVTVVPQEPILFDATMRENLLYGDQSATSRDLDHVLLLPQLQVVIQQLPNGLEHPLEPIERRLYASKRKGLHVPRGF